MCDEESVKLAQSGDKRAEEELIKKYTPLTRKICNGFFVCGGESEDLVQEGLFGLYSAISGYEFGYANFSTYAYACIRNAAADAVKKSLTAKNSALNNFVPIVEIGEELSPASPEDELIKRENRKEFLQKISKELSSLEFKVTVMHLDGLRIQEISEALEKSQKSISNAFSRAKLKLAKLYK